MQASTNSAAVAAQHETAAAAYSAALAAMPTLAELAANHAVHAVLVATNFFGINTIPIALNEADYVRMWIQAATTMATYQTVSGAAVASAPQTDPAPQIQKTDGNTNSGNGNQESGKNQDNGLGPGRPSWYVDKFNKIVTAIDGDLSKSSSPSAAIYNLLHDPVLGQIPHWAGEIANFFGPQLTDLAELSLGLIAPALATAPLAAAPLAAAGGSAGLAGLAGFAAPAPPAAAAAPVTPTPTIAPAGGPALPSGVATGSAPVSDPVPAVGAASATSPASPSPPPPPSTPPVTGVEGFGYAYLVGGGRHAERESTKSAGAGGEKKVPEPDTAATPAAATPERVRRHRRRRQTLTDPGNRYEYLDPDPDVTASDQGAQIMGFAGAVEKHGAERAAGLTTLAGDSFRDGPTMPMMPSSWDTGTDADDT